MKIATDTMTVKQINHTKTGQHVRQVREAKGISLRRLAWHMKISPPFLSDMERGRRNWTQERFDEALTAIIKIAAERKLP